MDLPEYIDENVPLAPFTTFQAGGPARFLSVPENEEELAETLALAKRLSLPVLALGGGSNLLVADAGVEAMVVWLSDEGEFAAIEVARRSVFPCLSRRRCGGAGRG